MRRNCISCGMGEQHEEDEEEVESDGGSDSGKEPKVTSTDKAKGFESQAPSFVEANTKTTKQL